MNQSKMVMEFQRSGNESMKPSNEVISLKNKLLVEEYDEFITSKTTVEELDALVDFMYVLKGFINVFKEEEKSLKDYGIRYEQDTNLDFKDLKITSSVDLLVSEVYRILLPGVYSLTVLKLLERIWKEISYISGYSPEVLSEAFNRVHKSNMSKFFDDGQLLEVLDFYKEEGVEVTTEKNELGKWIVKRKSDGKTLKGHLYTPVDLADLV